MPPFPMWFQGREAVVAALRASWDPGAPIYVGRFQMVQIRANRQPAIASYVQRPGDAAYHAFGIGVLEIDGHHIVEITAFHDLSLFTAFGLPTERPPANR
jgi:RNA polymerase sigma-70 factor, ECF subfamily